ncbi:hypothetical protein ACLOJK_024242 [Asimina triloba]
MERTAVEVLRDVFMSVSLEEARVLARMSGKQLITLEDLDVIREGYSIPSNIVLSVPAAHETPRDNHPRHFCMNEYMLGAGAYIVPHSWKVIRTMAWYCKRRGCSANQYLWRELLTHRSSQGYIEFLAWRNIKGIDNPPDSMPRWESRFFFARLTSEVDIWGIPERWEEPLPDSIP